MIDIIFLLKKKYEDLFSIYLHPCFLPPICHYLYLPLPTTTCHYTPAIIYLLYPTTTGQFLPESLPTTTCQFLPLSTCHCLPISTCTIYLYLPLFPPANVLFDRENEKILNIIFPEPWHIRSGYQIIPKIIFSILFWLQITPRK